MLRIIEQKHAFVFRDCQKSAVDIDRLSLQIEPAKNWHLQNISSLQQDQLVCASRRLPDWDRGILCILICMVSHARWIVCVVFPHSISLCQFHICHKSDQNKWNVGGHVTWMWSKLLWCKWCNFRSAHTKYKVRLIKWMGHKLKFYSFYVWPSYSMILLAEPIWLQRLSNLPHRVKGSLCSLEIPAFWPAACVI